MPYRRIPFVKGEIYHVMNRGVAKGRIFSDKRTYRRFINLLDYYRFIDVPVKYSIFLTFSSEERNRTLRKLYQQGEQIVDLFCFCLMPNHFHLLLRQLEDGGISLFMRKFEVSYGRYFNLSQQRVGPLIQGMFKAVHIETDEQLIHVSRYIHINSYVSHLVGKEQIFQYPWSSLPAYVEEVKMPSLNTQEISGMFSTPDQYRQFVLDEVDYKRYSKVMEPFYLE